jgi:UDP-GlcNAc3NAcA epimerase
VKRIITVVGARPQFVKAAVVSRALKESGIEELIIHTGQHFDANMSSVFFDELAIPPPRYNLGIGGGSHAQNTGRSMEGIEEIVAAERVDAVLVYGDTDSTLAGALAASKLDVPVAHVEAGLRSYNRRMPEEINRVVTDHLSSLLFAPSQVAVDNLAREGIAGEPVRKVGDVMYDAVLAFTGIAEARCNPLGDHRLERNGYVLATLHRKENTDDPERLQQILDGLAQSNWEVVLPLHPRTRQRLADQGLQVRAPLRILDPVGYLEMLVLEKNARAIATDSGGVQKEAFFHRVPCVTFRDETEWVELVELGVNVLVGAHADRIGAAINQKSERLVFRPIYGDGHASEAIAKALAER